CDVKTLSYFTRLSYIMVEIEKQTGIKSKPSLILRGFPILVCTAITVQGFPHPFPPTTKNAFKKQTKNAIFASMRNIKPLWYKTSSNLHCF
ncbi:MAG: hypothetical protein ABRQ39_32015, partial [Candidatus Eremiobacterota bacterium]